MPPKYRRLILGLIVFLGLMLLIGRFRLDTTRELPPPPAATATPAAAAALTGRRESSSPYAAKPCAGAREALVQLRSHRDAIISDIGFSNATDPYSLSSLLQRQDTLRKLELPDCLDQARGNLLTAAGRAETILSHYLDSDIDAFTLHARMQEAMAPALESAEHEFALVEETLQPPEGVH